jgi:hypothetical protein
MVFQKTLNQPLTHRESSPDDTHSRVDNAGDWNLHCAQKLHTNDVHEHVLVRKEINMQ